MTQQQETITNLLNLLDFEARRFLRGEILLHQQLPEWISAAEAVKLKIVLQKYHDFIQQHIQVLDQFFETEEVVAVSLENRIMQAYIEDARHKLKVCEDAAIKDACLLAAIQAINHYKISAYGTAAAFANALGMEAQAGIFHKAEVDEKQIDDRLSQLAEHEVNQLAKTPIILPG